MSSRVQWLGKIGAAGLPGITEHEFNDILRMIGQPIVFKLKQGELNCDCLDPNYGSFNPDCIKCGGTGFLSGWAMKVDRAYVEMRTERIQGEHQRLYMRPGTLDTFDGCAFIRGIWYDSNPDITENTGIKVDDVAIFKNTEFRITSIKPRWGSQQQRPVFCAIELEKPPYQISDATNIKRFQ